ncbi:MAG: nitrile hydratase accessory protein [Pseudomonadales bacterium]|nr:nitrile hydratase accessory protein [Pseudomonadales bacterium]MBO6564613.1 nitrile hydratase accessory protein [Pseudomonadales bacterium]MBO6597697.1 nitrile hydratase accessory protein [Pseudomonadales bacterium]MBO6657887.1 nitrile hydratase accessory protein [Pseudomonadales bacterium]MBO6704012.1 nitrile hydratase accessory protein [Pseudomonadales bacterium]
MAMELEGKATPPMANGEIVFEAPWQTRAFGMARALCEQGLYSWDEFRGHLIAEIEKYDAQPDGRGYEYFDHFLSALIQLLAEKQVCRSDELSERTTVFDERPHGHDH